MTLGLTAASTLLFVPGSRPDRFAKAAATGADLVVCDLEDAVAPTAKTAAREAVAGYLGQGGRAAVRVNAPGTPEHADDLAALSGCPGLAGVLVPMAERPRDLAEVAAALPGVALLALVETARGVRAAGEMAAVDGVLRLGVGHLDLAADLGADPDDPLLQHARHEIVLSARAAGSAAPVDGVTPDVRDLARVTAEAGAARAGGFGGKLCIHPDQVAAVAAAFTPTDEELAWADRVLAVADDGLAVVDGQMIDAPVVARARAVRERADRQHADPPRADPEPAG